ncbi:MAG: hypothetical protein LBV54_06860 [Puniceicoccales bacterium]|jgi:hypothetical protein|nr:hypothetical protein [Puniceicoccales bacterium]
MEKRRLWTLIILGIVLVVAISVAFAYTSLTRGRIMFTNGELAASEVIGTKYGAASYRAKQVSGPGGNGFSSVIAPEYVFIVDNSNSRSALKTYYEVTLERLFWVGWVAKEIKQTPANNDQELATYLQRRGTPATP